MSVEEFVGKMKSIQNNLLDFLEDETAGDDKYENFIEVISADQINNDKYKFKALLQLLNNIGSHHKRVSNFISKLEQILSGDVTLFLEKVFNQ